MGRVCLENRVVSLEIWSNTGGAGSGLGTDRETAEKANENRKKHARKKKDSMTDRRFGGVHRGWPHNGEQVSEGRKKGGLEVDRRSDELQGGRGEERSSYLKSYLGRSGAQSILAAEGPAAKAGVCVCVCSGAQSILAAEGPAAKAGV